MHNKIRDLKSYLEKIVYVGSAVSMLHWDQQVNMPKGAVDFRSNVDIHLRMLFNNYK